MRLITITAPKGNFKEIADLAIETGIKEVGLSETKIFKSSQNSLDCDKITIQTNTDKGRSFIDSLMASSFYDPVTFNITSRHPESIFAAEKPKEETLPLIRPSTDVYEELWEFCQITKSLIARVFLSALLVAYGMREDYMPLIIAGLLFLPYHHHLLGMAMGGAIKEKHLLKQAVLAFLSSTFLIILAGICIGFLTEPGVGFTNWKESSFFFSFLISAVIGSAAGFGVIDDSGRRELIGLAATAHLSIYPLWFGLKIIYGFEPEDKPTEHLLVFLMDFTTITLAAAGVLMLMKMKGKGIRKFIRNAREK